jgi:Polyketide cyclase / dehydrase and lipid transport
MPVMQGQATIHIDAPPERVYELVSDVGRMGQWSPECYRAEWVDGATGPAPGARFKGHNKRGPLRWSTKPTVLVANPGTEFAFRTRETVWRYQMQDGPGGGTDLTESFEVESYNLLFRIFDPPARRQPVLTKGIETTLQRIKAAAES